MKRTLIYALLIGLFSAQNVLATKLYKWTDDKGRVNYGQTKPQDFDAVLVDAPPPPPVNSPDLNKKFADQIRGAAAKKRGEGSSSSKDPKLCNKARANLDALQNNARVRYTNEDGETAIMPDDVKQQKIEESKQQVEKFCN